ncbi:hypothetical protein [Hespellia stercorisuis]|uniref:Uncharacterized protein n=1 Tax=Hespellia stercorisuis DSM 15480 TaxID=1121950 RepID=A0A1M6X182_9FIRM|nr:hypothetical protein [Hespellia stercorisuis]SHK99565.1 hypothetical protein SAMN02745243_04140 [Hespellia stercorisuis DSM 15480]
MNENNTISIEKNSTENLPSSPSADIAEKEDSKDSIENIESSDKNADSISESESNTSSNLDDSKSDITVDGTVSPDTFYSTTLLYQQHVETQLTHLTVISVFVLVSLGLLFGGLAVKAFFDEMG